jgi:hypothetical protein
MLTADEAVDLATRMRAAGVARFVLTAERFSAVLLPPPPPKQMNLLEEIGNLKPDERDELVNAAKREYDQDLFGASR